MSEDVTLPIAPDGWAYFRRGGIWFGIPLNNGTGWELAGRVDEFRRARA